MARVTIVRVFVVTGGRYRRMGVTGGRRALGLYGARVVVLMVIVIVRRRGSCHRILAVPFIAGPALPRRLQ